MILVDSSAWIAFLRDSESPACIRVDELLEEELAICEPVRMELLAGARDERHLTQLRGLLSRAISIPTENEDFEAAAAIYRVCWRNGTTPRRLIDCLIAAIAIRSDATILHADADFDAIAVHTTLKVE